MKFFSIFAPCLTISMVVFAKQIVLDIPDRDIAIVENDVIDAEQWLRDAWTGKLNKCKERMKNSEIEKSISSNETIPAGIEAIVDKHLARPDYENRREREEKLKKDSGEEVGTIGR